MRVVLGVAGGIAAYKAVQVLRLLSEAGHEVTVVPTAAALRFVGQPTWSSLSGRPVATDVWADAHEVPHVRLGRRAELLVVAPATADLLARAAHGLADDLLTNVLLTARCPVLLAPAMHTEMWEHPATRENVSRLRSRGLEVLDPDDGRLAGSDTGPGRLPEPERIVAAALGLVAGPGARTGGQRPDAPGDLRGRRVLVTAGGTREPLDPVRFLGNASSGRQGVALAEAARDRGAAVVLVAAHLEVAVPDGVEVRRVGTAAELHVAAVAAAAEADAVVMAAAVADFTPAQPAPHKIKKGGAPELRITLVRTVDVLADLAGHRRRPGQVVVGFAAETGDAGGSPLDHARAKLLAKGCDLLVVNDVGGGAVFGAATNAVTVIARDGEEVDEVAHVPESSKRRVADAVWDAVAGRLAAAPPD
ncbi:MAG: bifunctional phosphopantothenoylcysteine decarboxylase/phosphopantothenate--cysteine ligase CoaBC [Kineosporiaceae bacterium]